MSCVEIQGGGQEMAVMVYDHSIAVNPFTPQVMVTGLALL